MTALEKMKAYQNSLAALVKIDHLLYDIHWSCHNKNCVEISQSTRAAIKSLLEKFVEQKFEDD